MDITSAKYTSDDDQKGIKLVADGATMYVPINTDNRHYAAILEWVDAGNTIAAADLTWKKTTGISVSPYLSPSSLHLYYKQPTSCGLYHKCNLALKLMQQTSSD